MCKLQRFAINMMQKNPEGLNNDQILMQANGITPAYFVAAEGTIGSFNIGYTQPVQTKYFPNLKTVKFYNRLPS